MAKLSCKEGSGLETVAEKEAVALVKLGQWALPGTPLTDRIPKPPLVPLSHGPGREC